MVIGNLLYTVLSIASSVLPVLFQNSYLLKPSLVRRNDWNRESILCSERKTCISTLLKYYQRRFTLHSYIIHFCHLLTFSTIPQLCNFAFPYTVLTSAVQSPSNIMIHCVSADILAAVGVDFIEGFFSPLCRASRNPLHCRNMPPQTVLSLSKFTPNLD